jgi:hypothetical protein
MRPSRCRASHQSFAHRCRRNAVSTLALTLHRGRARWPARRGSPHGGRLSRSPQRDLLLLLLTAAFAAGCEGSSPLSENVVPERDAATGANDTADSLAVADLRDEPDAAHLVDQLDTAHAVDLQPLADEAALWGYPLVVSMRIFQALAERAGVNSLFWQTTLVPPEEKVIVSPDRDTVHVMAVLDLRSEPMALTVPAILDLHYSFQFLSAWTDAFAYVGSRATGAQAGTWVVVPPGWSGVLPEGARRLDSPTPQLLLFGQFPAQTDGDLERVHAMQPHVHLQPLSALIGVVPPVPPPALAPPAGPASTALGAGLNFYDELCDALVVNPPPPGLHAERLASYAALGIAPGARPSAAASTQEALGQEAALLAGLAQLAAALAYPSALSASRGPWRFSLDVGVYDEHALLLRAVTAHTLWGAHVPEETIYARATQWPSGQPLSGAIPMLVHFAPGQLPPVDAFWSLTLYGPDMFLVPNSADRYGFTGNTPGLVFGADGSLDIVVQHEKPATPTLNWLPAPIGPYQLVLRFSRPQAAMLADGWPYPSIEPANPFCVPSAEGPPDVEFWTFSGDGLFSGFSLLSDWYLWSPSADSGSPGASVGSLNAALEALGALGEVQSAFDDAAALGDMRVAHYEDDDAASRALAVTRDSICAPNDEACTLTAATFGPCLSYEWEYWPRDESALPFAVPWNVAGRLLRLPFVGQSSCGGFRAQLGGCGSLDVDELRGGLLGLCYGEDSPPFCTAAPALEAALDLCGAGGDGCSVVLGFRWRLAGALLMPHL